MICVLMVFGPFFEIESFTKYFKTSDISSESSFVLISQCVSPIRIENPIFFDLSRTFYGL